MRRQPSDRSIKILFASSGGLCAFPGCTTQLVQPQSRALLGELCHIRAASPGGPRFDPAQSEESRNDADNLIILCPTHHRLVDQDPTTYTADSLLLMKRRHESRVAAFLSSVAVELTDKQATDLSRQVEDESVDFAVVVALRKELAALKHYFPELVPISSTSDSTRTYLRGTIPRRGGSYRVVATLLHSMGNLDAAHATSDLIHKWKPRFVLVNGIAGGISRKDQGFGDIVASNSIFYYELSKVRPNHQEHRARQFQADPILVDGILNLTDSTWRAHLPSRPDGKSASAIEPRIHVGPIASGEKVIASSEAAQELRSLQRDLIAIEMESAGVASAAFSAVKKVGFLTIRAICDFADGKKNDMWQEYAAYSAASCLRSFIESRPVSLSEGAWPKSVASVAATKSRISIAQRKKLFDELCTAFDMEEFKNLCFLLGVDIDEIPGDRKSARVRELILLFERRDTLHVLEEAVDERTR
ncbi:nucleoside phosphorylase [Bradyrhizobium elkanii]